MADTSFQEWMKIQNQLECCITGLLRHAVTSIYFVSSDCHSKNVCASSSLPKVSKCCRQVLRIEIDAHMISGFIYSHSLGSNPMQ